MNTDSERPLTTDQAESDRPENGRPDNGKTDNGQTDSGQTDKGQTDNGQAGVDAAVGADPLAGLHVESNCAEILQRMHEFLDHELDADAADAIRAHLHACEDCLDDYDVVHALKALVNRCCRAQKAPQQLRMTIVTSMTRWRAG